MNAARAEIKYSHPAVFLALRPSRLAAAGVGLACAATLAVIAATPGPPGLRILAATWVACAALESIHSRALLRGARAVRRLRVGAGDVEVEDGCGGAHAGKLVPGSFVAPWLTIVRWRPAGARFDRTVAILPGMAQAADLRRLRVLLRWA